jgi:hypothetical protein
MDPQHIREAAQRFIGQLDRLEQGDAGAADDLLRGYFDRDQARLKAGAH